MIAPRIPGRLPPVPVDLVSKYNRPGPRYTSYPSTPHFRRETDGDDLRGMLQAAQATTCGRAPLGLYIHLPFCAQACWFCGCNKVQTRDHHKSLAYLDALEREIQLLLPYGYSARPLAQVHLGGGSPTFLQPREIERLAAILHRYFQPDSGLEFSLEADPRSLTPDKLEAFLAMGVNRVSLGVQDTRPSVQKAINRVQPLGLIADRVELLRMSGIDSINFDLVYGLPHQTVLSFEHTLDEVIGLEPDRIALYNYAHLPSLMPAQRMLERSGALPDAATKIDLFQTSVAHLQAAGYCYLGMDHFALEEDSLVLASREGTLQRNFQGYSTRAGLETLALGMSAISQGPDFYRQNAKDLKAYEAALHHDRLPVEKVCQLTPEDRFRRAIIMDTMCSGWVDLAEIRARTGFQAPLDLSIEWAAIDTLSADGLVQVIDGEAFQVTPLGRFFLRNIAMVFDAYLDRGALHSQTV